MRRALVFSAFLLIVAGATTASAAHVVRYVSKHPLPKKVGHGFCYITVPHVPRLRAVRPAPVPADGRAVLLRRRSGPVRVRRAALLVLRRASDRRRGRPLRLADVLLPARAALPLVRAAAADAVRAQGRRVLVRRQLRSGLLQRAPALRRDQRRLRAGRLHAAGRRRARRAARVPRRDRRGRSGHRARTPSSARRSCRRASTSRRRRRRSCRSASASASAVGAWWAAPAGLRSVTTTDATTAGTSTGAAGRRRRRTAGEARRRPQHDGGWRGSPAPARRAAWRGGGAARRPPRTETAGAAAAGAGAAARGCAAAGARAARAARQPSKGWSGDRWRAVLAVGWRSLASSRAPAAARKRGRGARAVSSAAAPAAAPPARRRDAARRCGDQGVAGRGPEPRRASRRSRRCRSAPCTASRGACRRSTRWCASTAIRIRSLAARRELLRAVGTRRRQHRRRVPDQADVAGRARSRAPRSERQGRQPGRRRVPQAVGRGDVADRRWRRRRRDDDDDDARSRRRCAARGRSRAGHARVTAPPAATPPRPQAAPPAPPPASPFVVEQTGDAIAGRAPRRRGQAAARAARRRARRRRAAGSARARPRRCAARARTLRRRGAGARRARPARDPRPRPRVRRGRPGLAARRLGVAGERGGRTLRRHGVRVGAPARRRRRRDDGLAAARGPAMTGLRSIRDGWHGACCAGVAMIEHRRHAPPFRAIDPRFSDAIAGSPGRRGPGCGRSRAARRRLRVEPLTRTTRRPTPARTSARRSAARRRPCAAPAVRRTCGCCSCAPGERNGDLVCTSSGLLRAAPAADAGADAGVDARRSSAALPFEAGPCEAAIPVYAFVDGACVAADLRRLRGERQPVLDARGVPGDVRGPAGPGRVPAQSDRARDLPRVRPRGRLREDGDGLRARLRRGRGVGRLRRFACRPAIEGVCQTAFCI